LNSSMTTQDLAHRVTVAYRNLFCPPQQKLCDLTIKSLEELGLILKPIYLRMMKEGWVLKNGKLTSTHGKSD